VSARLPPAGPSVPAWWLAVPVVVAITVATLVAAVALRGPGTGVAWVAAGSAAIGQHAPDFVSSDLDGHSVRLSSLQGRPVLLSFWATWCTACRAELPTLQQIETGYRSSGLTVLAVDYRETDTAAMRSFLRGLDVDFRGVLDPQGTIAAAYRVDIGLPVNVWVDRSQTVSQIMVGEQPGEALAAAAAAASR
jgi:cytochrome c biogenesis protein CcmG, thiol:disulfide interchange protein DsbE